MEQPEYAALNEAELREIEAEFGRPVTTVLALWFIRNRTNRDAVERLLRRNEVNEPQLELYCVAFARNLLAIK